MPEQLKPSEDALAALMFHMVADGVRIDDSNREAHRELERAGLTIAGHTIAYGPESGYHFTEDGWKFARETWPSAAPEPPQ